MSSNEEPTIHLDIDGSCATMMASLKMPSGRNSAETCGDLLFSCAANPGIRLVIQARGNDLCLGGNLSEFLCRQLAENLRTAEP